MSDRLSEVADYYSGKLAEHGRTPQGVDWNGEDSQLLRFTQLGRLIDTSAPFTVNDLGCGYGAMFEYLDANYPVAQYFGQDISLAMVEAAAERHAKSDNAMFQHTAEPPQVADYGFASGILNVRLGASNEEWEGYVGDMLDKLNSTSRRGFAFNCLTSYSDADRMRDYLYYASPTSMFDRCKQSYARNVALLHDYGLYEFTVLVRKA
jgi:SAM-dependent methyltransferase